MEDFILTKISVKGEEKVNFEFDSLIGIAQLIVVILSLIISIKKNNHQK